MKVLRLLSLAWLWRLPSRGPSRQLRAQTLPRRAPAGRAPPRSALLDAASTPAPPHSAASQSILRCCCCRRRALTELRASPGTAVPVATRLVKRSIGARRMAGRALARCRLCRRNLRSACAPAAQVLARRRPSPPPATPRSLLAAFPPPSQPPQPSQHGQHRSSAAGAFAGEARAASNSSSASDAPLTGRSSPAASGAVAAA
jgi:hypothetical protein